MNLHRSPEQIRAKFDELREICDDRGHDLLHELEVAALAAISELSLDDRIIALYARTIDATNAEHKRKLSIVTDRP